MSDAKQTKLNDSDILIRVDDGVAGHFVTRPAPKWSDTPANRTHLARGEAYDATRVGQAAAKKERKREGSTPASIKAAAQKAVSELNGENVPETIGSMRTEIATAGLSEVLKTKGFAANEANIAQNLGKYMAKHAKAIDAKLHAMLAEGYTPSRKGASGATATGGAVDLGDDL